MQRASALFIVCGSLIVIFIVSKCGVSTYHSSTNNMSQRKPGTVFNRTFTLYLFIAFLLGSNIFIYFKNRPRISENTLQTYGNYDKDIFNLFLNNFKHTGTHIVYITF